VPANESALTRIFLPAKTYQGQLWEEGTMMKSGPMHHQGPGQK